MSKRSREMAERVVVDTGPLIALARADALIVIGALPIESLRLKRCAMSSMKASAADTCPSRRLGSASSR
jgi:hypothetical protein